MLYFVEAATTGAGLSVMAELHASGREVALVTGDPARYESGRGAEILPELRTLGRLHVEDTTASELVRRRKGQKGPVGVISATDKYLPYAARLADAVGAPFLSVDAAELLRDKRRARQLFDQLEIGHVRWSDAPSASSVRDFSESIRAPIIIKNVVGSGSMDIAFAIGADEAEGRWEALAKGPRWLNGDLMVEEFIAGPLVSLETLVSHRRPIFLGVTDRQLSTPPTMAEVGYGFPARVEDTHESSMRAAVEKLVDALAIEQGFLHVEFILTPNGTHLVEVNGRLPGGLFVPMLKDCLKGDFYELLHDSALGRAVRFPGFSGMHSNGYVSYVGAHGLALEDSRVSDALHYPWIVDVVGGVRRGDVLAPVADFRGSVAHVRSLAPTASLAFSAARSAAEMLVPKTTGQDPY